MADSPTREQVRRLQAKGLSVREIATLLSISTQAVYKHLRKIEQQKAAS